ncbi:Choline transport protein [Fulvia fulva]|uniref:Choline transport protein n=1 Tax=Passalora fulva TaxID=5499 RepID=A0A9Q8LDI1_PASFU|nr:Choline transport protein [Fulvia fulva]KAK4629112.1 Choline transport protein [Fulvia fulva]UJO15402.1 Choline transport protein [Fulvia fulva]WPV12080.1 Choline transport protein [Fulvia fulva]WPV27324.1 Choline transport protein [Fulvia fulva]
MADNYGTYRRESKVDAYNTKESLPRDSRSSEPADDLLEALGYTQQLARSRSTLNVMFMSFVLASVPYGLATTLIYPLTGGGPTTIIWGWVAVCLLMLCVAASLGEITSVYPLAGGVYYQTFMLASPRWRKLAAWMTGWSFTLGNIIITLSVNFGTTLFLIGCINVFQVDDGTGTGATVGIFQVEAYQTYLIFLGITILCTCISCFGNKWLHHLDTAAVIWTFLGVIAIIVCILAIAAEGRRRASWVFGGFEVTSGWNPPGWAFCIGLLHGAYATSATGMVVSMCEEVQQPATQVPKAIVGALLMNMACGLVFLIPVCFVIQDLTVIATDPSGQPLPVILRSAIGNEVGAFVLTVPIIILGILCGTGCTTAASRCTWAFARDGAIPGSRKFGFDTVNDKFGLPLNAMLLCFVVQAVLGLIYLGSSAAFNAFNGSGVIFLTLSYVIPVAISFFGGRKRLSAGKFNLGAFGWFANAVSIAWCAFAIPLFSMPSALPVTMSSMNYASCVFVGGFAIAGFWYVVWGRSNYAGPKVTEATEEMTARRISTVSATRQM